MNTHTMETKHTPEPWEEYAGNIRTVEANEKYGDGYRAEFRRRPCIQRLLAMQC